MNFSRFSVVCNMKQHQTTTRSVFSHCLCNDVPSLFSFLACDCFMFGITNNGTCNQTTGQCECKQNVTGRQCDGCADTFWGFRLPPIGDCRGK